MNEETLYFTNITPLACAIYSLYPQVPEGEIKPIFKYADWSGNRLNFYFGERSAQLVRENQYVDRRLQVDALSFAEAQEWAKQFYRKN